VGGAELRYDGGLKSHCWTGTEEGLMEGVTERRVCCLPCITWSDMVTKQTDGRKESFTWSHLPHLLALHYSSSSFFPNNFSEMNSNPAPRWLICVILGSGCVRGWQMAWMFVVPSIERGVKEEGAGREDFFSFSVPFIPSLLLVLSQRISFEVADESKQQRLERWDNCHSSFYPHKQCMCVNPGEPQETNWNINLAFLRLLCSNIVTHLFCCLNTIKGTTLFDELVFISWGWETRCLMS